MTKYRSKFVKATTSKCGGKASVHVGVLGRGHRGCAHNTIKSICVWVSA